MEQLLSNVSTSGAAKTPVSSSGKCLHLPDQHLSVHYADAKQTLLYPISLYTGVYDVQGSSYGPFQCCGSQVLHGLSGRFSNEREMQDAAALFLRTKHDYRSWYFIASTPQVNAAKNNTFSVLNWLIEMGAKEIDARPNKFHTPNKMHLFVLTLTDNPNLDKFVKNLGPVPGSYHDGFGHLPQQYEPLWWAKLSNEEQVKWLESNKKALEEKLAAQKAQQEAINARQREGALWNWAYAQYNGQDRVGSPYINMEELLKALRKYGEAVIEQRLVDHFQRFIDLSKGVTKK